MSIPSFVILLTVIILASVFFRIVTSVRKSPSQNRETDSATPPGFKKIRSIMGLVTFAIFIGYYFLHIDILIWVGIGLVILLDLSNVLIKIMASANRSAKSSPAINEQPAISTPIARPSSPYEQNEVYPVTKSISSSGNSIDYFDDPAATPKWVVLLITVMIVIGTAVAVLYFTGSLDRIIQIIFS